MTDFTKLLKPGYQSAERAGWYARVEGGQLREFGYYLNGRPMGKYLILDPSACVGHVDERGSTYPDDDDQHRALFGMEEKAEDQAEYAQWVEDWIIQLYHEREAAELYRNLVCDFCGKNNTEVKKLIAGPKSYICDECVDLCHEIVEEERSRPTPT